MQSRKFRQQQHCATEKTKKADPIEPIAGQMQGDVYTGTDTVGYLAEGVKDRVFLLQMNLF